MALALLLALVPDAPLDRYLRRQEPPLAFESATGSSSRVEGRFTSQTWRGEPWTHDLVYQAPPEPLAKGTAILYITGDGPKSADYRDLALIAGATRLPVAMLFDVPNQPLYGMKEDDLIAHTFEQYLKSPDPEWPLLFPMTKSALRAMDVVQELTKDTGNPIRRFVVTGASKRGWTTWLVGASRDRRVAGIAPMVYDNLDLAAQMRHQRELWNGYSPAIEEYTRRGLQDQLLSGRTGNLGELVDPFRYRDRIRVPLLVVNGANDPYWAVDAARFYFPALRGPKALVAIPNAGHDLGNKVWAVESVGQFARTLATGGRFPEFSAVPTRRWDRVSFQPRPQGGTPVRYRLWTALSPDAKFVRSEWSPSDRLETTVPAQGASAAFVEARYRVGDREFSLTSVPVVLRR